MGRTFRIKVAHSVYIERCPCGKCDQIGLTLLDGRGTPMATLSIPAHAVPELTHDLNDLSSKILSGITLEHMECQGNA